MCLILPVARHPPIRPPTVGCRHTEDQPRPSGRYGTAKPIRAKCKSRQARPRTCDRQPAWLAWPGQQLPDVLQARYAGRLQHRDEPLQTPTCPSALRARAACPARRCCRRPALAGQLQGALESGISSSTTKASALSAEVQADSTRSTAFKAASKTSRRGSTRSKRLWASRSSAQPPGGAACRHAHRGIAEVQLAQDRKALVAQVIAAYEDPPPSIVTVIL